MNVSVTAAPLPQVPAEALIVGVKPGQAPHAELDQATSGAIAQALKSRTFKAKAEQTLVLFPVTGLQATRVVLVGLGEEALDAEAWRRAVSAGVNALKGEVSRLAIALPEGLDGAKAAEAGAESAILSAYQFHPYQKPDPDEIRLEEVLLVTGAAGAAESAAKGAALARNVSWVRDLSNLPGNKLVPQQLVDEAVNMAKAAGLTSKVWDFEALQREGFGCLVAIGQGSENKPAFVAIEYKGGKPDEKPVVLVGKGITFDTGGIDIKPRAGMEEMKTDMHGAATVLATLKAAAERKLPVNLVGLCCIAENMPNGDAIKPGDIVTSYNGLTVEILDTDAEGRLVLSDGLGYGVKHYQPRAIIDLATLTGSIIMALGYEATGLFTNSDQLARELIAAGETTGERCWRFPTWDSYAEQVKSDIADLRNIGKGKGDAINAAKYLENFVAKTPWVHLDIAGSSFIPSDKPYRPKGSTGVGVRLLIEWLERSVAGAQA
jgi:leucyl aminopeptidase